MKIRDKLYLDRQGLEEHGPINVVIFGDSVSHGSVNGYYDFENVYWNRLKKKLHLVKAYMPINMINVSVGGTTAAEAVKRLGSQVLCHRPDAVIVCFGLNDVNCEKAVYLNALTEIFERCADVCDEVIFMTPNMMNTYIADDIPPENLRYALKTMKYQNSGKMDDYIYSAKALAENMGITVCDCYTEWKRIAETEDTTLLLANRVNHPTPKMHELFAEALFKVIMGEEKRENGESDDAMYREN